MLANPIALACGDFQCGIDIITRVIRSANPFRDSKFRIEKENNIRVRKLCSRPTTLKPDRIKKRVDVLLSTGAQTSQAESFRGRDKRSTSPGVSLASNENNST